MSKRTRTLLFSGIAVLVLTALLVTVLLLPEPEIPDDGDNDPVDLSVTLLDKVDKDDKAIPASKVTVVTGGETYTLTADKDGDMTVDRYKDLPHSSTALDALSTELEQFRALRKITDTPATPADYGFGDDTLSKVSVTYSDDTAYGFEIGKKAPSGDGYYFREQGKDTVYLYATESAEVFMEKSTAYLSRALITVPTPETTDEAAQDTAVVRDVELFGSVRKSSVFFQAVQKIDDAEDITAPVSGYVIQRPYFHGVDSNATVLTTTAFSVMGVTDVVKVYPTAAELKSYGFDDPYSACTVNFAIRRPVSEKNDKGEETTSFTYYNVLKYTIKLGNKTKDGLRYFVVYAEDKLIPIVYVIDESNVAWANVQYDDLAETLLFYLYITNVDTVTVTANGATTQFKLKHVADEDDRDKSMIVTANGKPFSTPDFRTVYQEMLGMRRSGTAPKKPSGTPVFELDILTNTVNDKPVHLKIYKDTASKYTVLHDSGEYYSILAKDVEGFIALYQSLLDNNA